MQIPCWWELIIAQNSHCSEIAGLSGPTHDSVFHVKYQPVLHAMTHNEPSMMESILTLVIRSSKVSLLFSRSLESNVSVSFTIPSRSTRVGIHLRATAGVCVCVCVCACMYMRVCVSERGRKSQWERFMYSMWSPSHTYTHREYYEPETRKATRRATMQEEYVVQCNLFCKLVSDRKDMWQSAIEVVHTFKNQTFNALKVVGSTSLIGNLL